MIVFGMMGGILLPARLLFVEFVTDDWLGSFGIIALVSISLILLAKKNKLGFFGPMLERQIFKFQKGKRGILIFAESAFLLVILGTMIFAIDQGHSVYAEQKMQHVSNSQNQKNQVIESAKNMTPSDWIYGTIMAPMGFVTAFPQMSAAMASIDQKLDGWLMHFYTVGFVEYLELLGILTYYRISYKQKISQNVFQFKTPIR
ncbi:hypothetical protein [Candidatus Nitrosopumilus sediminis]|uniref:Uncharacterized protein n=1 Tax=Candidatus Nitrosopumilus sediminis TaxID=1229909 RepID=K0BBV8_9ARCH|nr:hypothetical protein [Candidatus Nitrosopumilus sediminis]AFS82617.1 hypothetical protein NSED_04055 [Candidatus Nitrosopumilus sediminis]